MNITEAKDVLKQIGYELVSDDWYDMIEELHQNYKAQVVGGSMNTLGDSAPLFMRAGNAAFMVDNKDDLFKACVRIKQALDARKGAETVTIKKDVYAFNLKTIESALENEVDQANRVKRPLAVVDTEYAVKYNPETRTQTRKSTQIMNDLLSDDKKRNAKAVEAFKAILIIDRGSVTQ